jgi:hypothetical protein
MREEETENEDSLGVSALGSGSDYTVFLQRIGVGILLNSNQTKGTDVMRRSQAPRWDLRLRCTILCITIILCTTLRDGRNYTLTQVFLNMSVTCHR